MSALARKLVGGAAEVTTASGSLTGSGSLAIPAGVTLITLTGRGGTGGDNSYYDPGQPYIAPSGWVAPSLISTNNHGRSITWEDTDYSNWPTCTDTPASAGPTNVVVTNFNNGGRTDDFLSWDCPVYSAGYYSNPGQAYVAPSSGGGVYSGNNTTAMLNGITDTWAGGNGGAASPSVQTLTSNGLGQSLTYSIGSGGSLSYSYQY